MIGIRRLDDVLACGSDGCLYRVERFRSARKTEAGVAYKIQCRLATGERVLMENHDTYRLASGERLTALKRNGSGV